MDKGISIGEIKQLSCENICFRPFNKSDVTKLKYLHAQQDQFMENKSILQELELMRTLQQKAEIEALLQASANEFYVNYLIPKLERVISSFESNSYKCNINKM